MFSCTFLCPDLVPFNLLYLRLASWYYDVILIYNRISDRAESLKRLAWEAESNKNKVENRQILAIYLFIFYY